MKTRRTFSSLAYSAAVVVWMSTVFGAGNMRAGGVGGIGGVGAAASTGGGGHAAVSSTGSGHISAPAVNHSAGISRVGSGNLHPITATYAGPPHYLSGGFTPNTVSRPFGASAGINRPASAAPLAMQTATARSATPTVATVRNAWTDPASSQRTGQFLYPNANRDILGNVNASGRSSNGSSRNGFSRFRSNRLGYYDPYIYGYPGVFGGYSPYLYGDGLGTADLNSDFTGGAPNTVADSDAVSPATQSDLSRPYPSAQFSAAPDSADTAAPQAPAAANVQPANGPDSLVEAVQAELSRRGYFGGKVDSIYNDATHAAIQRFQQDQKLPASGRINEATLHALELD